MPYEWYEVVADPALQQGDFLLKCLAPVVPTIVLPDQDGNSEHAPKHEPELFDRYDRVVILSQSCDLADGELQRVMVCPTPTLDQFLSEAVGENQNKRNSAKAELRKGRRPAYHLLNSCALEGLQTPHLVADFGDAFSIPLEYALKLAGDHARVRLLPPYREQLAQMFARFYMRVGLPIEVADFP